MPKKTDRNIDPINAPFDKVAKSMVATLGTAAKSKNINKLSSDLVRLGTTQDLFHVEKQVEFDNIEMGVLESGVPYLTSRGLARMIGIDHGPFHRLTTNWAEESLKPRGRAITKLLEEQGYYEDTLYLKAEYKGSEINAFTEPVCLALLEYYAFVAEERRDKAISAFRSLARIKFREFIYGAVGYNPSQQALDKWKHFHDRVDMTQDAAPVGYWGVFREIAVMIVPMIRNGIMISDRVVPDISVGKAWSEFWKDNNMDEEIAPRTRYDHEYPDYYPQAKSNPQPSYAYPNAALGLFRDWLQKNYILTKFPKYLLGQTSKGALTMAVANKAIEAFGAKQIEHKPQAKKK
jgi:hypothetical protein